MSLTIASDTSTCCEPPLLIISTLSPTFKFDLSGFVFRMTLAEPPVGALGKLSI